MGHIQVRLQCGLCGSSLATGDDLYLLFENLDLQRLSGIQGPFRQGPGSPSTWASRSTAELCRLPDCERCAAASNEPVTVHTNCFHAIRKYSGLSGRSIWEACAWRSPWSGAPGLNLGVTPPQSLDDGVLKAAGLEVLNGLPKEVLDMIYCYSRSSGFWKLCASTAFARRAGQLEEEERVMSLADVGSWDRQEGLQRWGGGQGELLRIEMDAMGVKSIESLQEYPEPSPRRSDCAAYVVLSRDEADQVIAHFKIQKSLGAQSNESPKMETQLQRARLRKGEARLQIWDKPVPPLPGSCAWSDDVSRYPHLRTINLDEAFGLTFIFRSGLLHSIQVHTAAKPAVAEGMESDDCIHIPLGGRGNRIAAVAINEPIREIGSQFHGRTMILGMEHGGQIVLGRINSDVAYESTFKWSASYPEMLIQSSRFASPHDFMFGASLSASVPSEEALLPRVGWSPLRRHIYTAAPLVDVVRAWTFSRNGTCEGMVLEYGDGAKRSVGDVRVGLDEMQVYDDPKVLYLKSKSPTKGYTDAAIDGTPWREWIAFDIKDGGLLEWCVYERQRHISIFNGSDGEVGALV